MAEKPESGICFQCGSENLEFRDDGTGRCNDCEREYNWEEPLLDVMSTEDTVDEVPDMSPSDLKHTSRYRAFSPSRQPSVLSRKKPRNTFLIISVLGMVVMMLGYGLLFSVAAENDMAESISTPAYIAYMLTHLGVIILGLGLLYGAATAEHLDANIRAWMLLAMAILLAAFLTFGNSSLMSLIN